MILKNPTNVQVGPYNIKGVSYGPIAPMGKLTDVPADVAQYIKDRIHNFLTVENDSAPEKIVLTKEDLNENPKLANAGLKEGDMGEEASPEESKKLDEKLVEETKSVKK